MNKAAEIRIGIPSHRYPSDLPTSIYGWRHFCNVFNRKYAMQYPIPLTSISPDTAPKPLCEIKFSVSSSEAHWPHSLNINTTPDGYCKKRLRTKVRSLLTNLGN